MYVNVFYLFENDNDFVIIGFEADAINLLHTFVFLKSPTIESIELTQIYNNKISTLPN